MIEPPASGTGLTRRNVLFAGLAAGAGVFGIPRRVWSGPAAETRVVGPLRDSVMKGPLVWDVRALGYESQEYLVSGFADVLRPVSMADAPSIFSRNSTADFAVRDFKLHLISPARPYTTRLVVYRPRDLRKFSGRVIVETLHPFGGGRGLLWNAVHSFFMASGDAYIGVQHPLTFPALRSEDSARYGTLRSSDPTQLWGMLIDAGRLVKRGEVDSPLHGYAVERLLMTGYSFTGVATATFANYYHDRARMPGGGNIFDAYLPMADAQYVRPLDVPVMRLNTQSDFNGFGGLHNRRPDDPRYRHYEVAGACHVAAAPPADAAVPPRIASLPTPAGQPKFSADACEKEFPAGAVSNDFPLYLFQESMFANMYAWLDAGAPPPHSRYIETTTDGAARLDVHGNALGGVRYPEVSVPVARYGIDATGDCVLFGYKVPFSQTACRRLYGSREHYLARVHRAAGRLARQRLLTEPGVDRLAAIAGADANF